MTLDKKRQRRKPKKIKKELSRIQPYYQTSTQDFTTSANTAGMNFTLTDDGYNYVDIRTLLNKINEIIDYIKGEK